MKVKYNKITGLIEGYFPSQLHYPSNIIDLQNETIDGSPYITMTLEDHRRMTDKKVKVENGIIREITQEEDQINIQTINDEILSKMSYLDKRKNAYGKVEQQLQNIIEKGLEFEQKRVLAINAQYPVK
tara:strand:+ start:825 stop:1208 length:384 start_codon:yes stop_codon:yes gene_type:complete